MSGADPNFCVRDLQVSDINKGERFPVSGSDLRYFGRDLSAVVWCDVCMGLQVS